MANEYARILGARDPLEVLAGTPARLQEVMERLGPERCAQAPAPGKWSVERIACHLADLEVVFAFRIRQILGEEHHVVQPMDQDRWAQFHGACERGMAPAVFGSVRRWNMALLGSLGRAELERAATHPERGEITLRAEVEMMAGHDLHHLGQMETMAAQG